MREASHATTASCRVVVIWIDWYPYHVARMRGLCAAPTLRNGVVGIEMVSGVGVHAGLKFREPMPQDLPILSLMPGVDWKSANKLTLSRLLWRKLNQLDPEGVLVPGYYTLPAIAAAVWARVHGRVSVLMTESAAYDHVRQPAREWLKKCMLRMLFDRAITGGRDHEDYLGHLGFPADSMSPFYDVVDNDFYRDGTARLRASGRASDHGLPAQYFLYVGRLAPEKNVLGLLDAWLAYRKQGGTWALVLAGDGPERDALQERLHASPLASDVIITGLRSATELLPLYAFASTFVLASTREPWGLVVNEAMASALPVIVTDRCGCANNLVRDAGCGVVVPAGDLSAFTAAMHALANPSQGDRDAMGAASQDRIRPYSPQRFGLEVATLVDRAAAQQPRYAPGRAG